MKNEKAKLLLLPVCVLLGIVLLFAFVSFSHNYLSDYFVQNSKELIGQKIDLKKFSEHIGDSRLLGFSKAHGDLKAQIIFWSMTCSPCLEKLSQTKNISDQDLVLVVNVDEASQSHEASQVLAQLAPQFNFYQDKEGFLLKTFKIDYLPAYVTLDSQGTVLDIQAGPSVFGK